MATKNSSSLVFPLLIVLISGIIISPYILPQLFPQKTDCDENKLCVEPSPDPQGMTPAHAITLTQLQEKEATIAKLKVEINSLENNIEICKEKIEITPLPDEETVSCDTLIEKEKNSCLEQMKTQNETIGREINQLANRLQLLATCKDDYAQIVIAVDKEQYSTANALAFKYDDSLVSQYILSIEEDFKYLESKCNETLDINSEESVVTQAKCMEISQQIIPKYTDFLKTIIVRITQECYKKAVEIEENN